MKDKKFDAIHVDHSCMMPLGILAKQILKIPLGLRLHNIEWTIWDRYAKTLPLYSPKFFYIKQQAKLLKKHEIGFYKQADICFAITDIDQALARFMSANANIKIASAGVNIQEWKPKNIQRNQYEIILATTYKWIHNVNAVKWLINNVMPILKQSIPQIQLTLIGRGVPDWFANFKHIGVNPVGYVNQVQEYYNKASVFVSPLFVGGGIRIKILEAMAMKLPVVATPIAAEGINANHNNGLFIEQDTISFANRIIELLNNYSDTRNLGASARNFIIDNYTWHKNVSIMINEYKRMTNQ